MLFHSRRYLPPNWMVCWPLIQVTLSSRMPPVRASSLRLSESQANQSSPRVGQPLAPNGLGVPSRLGQSVKSASVPELLYERCAPISSSLTSSGENVCVCVMETLLILASLREVPSPASTLIGLPKTPPSVAALRVERVHRTDSVSFSEKL